MRLFNPQMQASIEAGNITRNRFDSSNEEHVNLYVGSGSCGASLNAFGLMNEAGHPQPGIGKTVFMHAEHWHRGAYGLDYYLPLARVVWANPFPDRSPDRYRQELRLDRGAVCTEMSWPELELRVQVYGNPEQREELAFEIEYWNRAADQPLTIRVNPELDLRVHYNQQVKGELGETNLDPANGIWDGRIRAGTADTTLACRVISLVGEAVLEQDRGGYQVGLKGEAGKHILHLAAARHERREELRRTLLGYGDPSKTRLEAAAAWERRWGTSYLQLPDPNYQAMWARSLYYVLCSYAPDTRSPAPVMGWTGNGWPFHFPQDLSYIHPALLRLGHHDIAKAWVEMYHSHMASMERMTRSVYKAEGTMWAWVFPIGPHSELYPDGAPNKFHYEIHNAAYPAKMAAETAAFIKDRNWTVRHAWPIVQGSARFYSSLLKQEADGTGTWGIHVIPSMGQDEFGGENAKNYLCALYAARYSLQAALGMAETLGIAEEEQDRWRNILADGLAFPRLFDLQTGLYGISESGGGEMKREGQKHPVQLIPLAFLPLGRLDEPLKQAFASREQLCSGAASRTYHGWTLAAYWLAASHADEPQALLRELEHIQPGTYADPDWIQFYETSDVKSMPYYVTTHGLFLQALNDAMLSDYWGPVKIGAACPESWERVAFHGFHTADGAIWSGIKRDGEWQLQKRFRDSAEDTCIKAAK